jgi:FKBP-type peptidyl-prolyl cis-trans isomerase SlyD
MQAYNHAWTLRDERKSMMKQFLLGAMAAALIMSGMGLGSLAYAEKPLLIGDGMMVTLEYTLTLPDKTVADSTAGQAPFAYTQGNHEIIPGLEKALTGLKPGDKKRITVPAAEAYGLYDEKKKVTVPKSKVPPDVKVGTRLRSQDGMEAKVAEIKGDSVVVDVNHPLAGKDLTFDVNILKVEKAPKPAKEK